MCKITHIYLFFFRARYVHFLSFHGSSLVGLPFPPLGCLSVVFVHVTCPGSGYIDEWSVLRVAILAFLTPNLINMAFLNTFGVKISVWRFGFFLAFFRFLFFIII